MAPRMILFALWLALVVGFLAWCGWRTFYIGQMPLPRAQALAIGLVLVFAVTLAVLWLWAALVAGARLFGLASSSFWIDAPWARAALLTSMVGVAGLLLYGRYIEPRWIKVREVAPWPVTAAEDAARIAVISDLHVDGAGPPWDRLADKVNEANPDVVLFLGDALNRPAGLPQLQRALAAMEAPQGKFAVAGNWETWYWHELPLLEGTGFRWLEGQARTLKIREVTIHLLGFPFRNGQRGAEAEAALRRLPAEGWRIMLYHTPDLALAVPSADLYLAGHTHGGQVSLPFFGALATLSRHGKRFERGLRWVEQTAVYVTPGIGVEPMIPLRLGVRPEVTLLRLPPKGQTSSR